jgi:ubiquinone/menaquinone biosynthesis C-methylase UbiE
MSETLEQAARRKYNDEEVYDPGKITHSLYDESDSYSAQLLREKAAAILPHVRDKHVLDLGCANGRHLAEMADRIFFGVGMDFSERFIRHAAWEYRSKHNLSFVVADGRAIPLKSESIDYVYSFGTLYHIDEIEFVYTELNRVLRPNGMAILEVGNACSLSTLISRQPQYCGIAQHSSRTINQHFCALRRQRLDIVQWRSFQILPMWGAPPWWLKLGRLAWLERLVMRKAGGRMLDEWISSLPGLRQFAFRHLLLVRKSGQRSDNRMVRDASA